MPEYLTVQQLYPFWWPTPFAPLPIIPGSRLLPPPALPGWGPGAPQLACTYRALPFLSLCGPSVTLTVSTVPLTPACTNSQCASTPPDFVPTPKDPLWLSTLPWPVVACRPVRLSGNSAVPAWPIVHLPDVPNGSPIFCTLVSRSPGISRTTPPSFSAASFWYPLWDPQSLLTSQSWFALPLDEFTSEFAPVGNNGSVALLLHVVHPGSSCGLFHGVFPKYPHW